MGKVRTTWGLERPEAAWKDEDGTVTVEWTECLLTISPCGEVAFQDGSDGSLYSGRDLPEAMFNLLRRSRDDS